MQPAWPGELEALPQPPPPANAIISLYYSQILRHIRWWYITPQRITIHLSQQSHRMIEMTLYRQTPDGVSFIMSQDVLVPVNFLPNKTAVLDIIKGRPV